MKCIRMTDEISVIYVPGFKTMLSKILLIFSRIFAFAMRQRVQLEWCIALRIIWTQVETAMTSKEKKETSNINTRDSYRNGASTIAKVSSSFEDDFPKSENVAFKSRIWILFDFFRDAGNLKCKSKLRYYNRCLHLISIFHLN